MVHELFTGLYAAVSTSELLKTLRRTKTNGEPKNNAATRKKVKALLTRMYHVF